jgi:antitoxin FitA
MVDILVRNVADDVAKRLKEKAAVSGRSLSETAREALSQFVKPSRAELLAEMDRIRAMSPYSDVDSTLLIREDRDNDEPYR